MLHEACLTPEPLARITLCSVNISACWWWTAQDWSKVSWEPVYGPVSWAEVGNRIVEEKERRGQGGERERRHRFWWLRGGGGRLHMKPWPQKMDKTIAWKLAGEGGTAWCVLGLLDNTEVEGGRGGGREKWENDDVVRGRREEEPEWGIIIIKNKINRPWGSQQRKNNGIQVFEDKTAALIEALQLTSCEKQREEISFLVGGGG